MVEDARRCILSIQEDGFEYIDRVLLLSFGGGEYGEVYGKSLCARQGSAAERDFAEYDGQAQGLFGVVVGRWHVLDRGERGRSR